jgi:ParB-like chromosome segregation protein Spo0J
VAIASIEIDAKTQSRIGMRQETIRAYAEEFLADRWDWDIAPLPVLFYEHDQYFIGDGHHRIAAATQAGLETIRALVKPGGLRDAQLWSAGANKFHGLPRTNDDKRKQVTMMLLDDDWQEWSNHAIASHCGVSAPFVGKVRRELEATGTIEEVNERKSKDGKARDTAKIGKSQGKARAAGGNTKAPATPEPEPAAPPKQKREVPTVNPEALAKAKGDEPLSPSNVSTTMEVTEAVEESDSLAQELRKVQQRLERGRQAAQKLMSAVEGLGKRPTVKQLNSLKDLVKRAANTLNLDEEEEAPF